MNRRTRFCRPMPNHLATPPNSLLGSVLDGLAGTQVIKNTLKLVKHKDKVGASAQPLLNPKRV